MGTITIAGPARLPQPFREELFDVIREQGFAPAFETETETRDLPSPDVLLWTRDHLAAPVAIALATAVARRIGAWRKKRNVTTGAVPIVRVIYAPDGSELARVPVPDLADEE